MAANQNGINIGTISGGIVNFGGAVYISPISVTKTAAGSGGENQGAAVTTASGLSASNQTSIADLIDLIRRRIE
ncbi:spore germination protein [Neobacillus soli]|uniref:spore germination protein n=1 Tax=Neobacillus soli TaxID=220688 RepID=UPI000825715B|nr:spore germination protein [Neobacillus soli]